MILSRRHDDNPAIHRAARILSILRIHANHNLPGFALYWRRLAGSTQ